VKLIAGLGNPGVRYEGTRHNAGFATVDELARNSRNQAWSRRCQSLVAFAAVAEEPALLAKPLTFMNASGTAIQLLLDEFRLGAGDLVLILDDLNLPLGKIRIRRRGSAGGHKGLESVIRALNSEEFIRVRLGIGEEGMPEEKAGFVLSDLPQDRMPQWNEMIARAAEAVRMIVSGGLTRAMSMFNA